MKLKIVHAGILPSLISACVKGGRLKNIHQNSMIFHNRISYDLGYGGIPDCDESEHIAKAFDGKNICILGNHGVAAVGTRVCDVFNDLYYLERAAMVQVSSCIF